MPSPSPAGAAASPPSRAVAPLRCHLLIGPPASGKTTLARALAPLLSGPGDPAALVLSTDAIRAEVFGDAAVQGPWLDIQQRLHQRLREAVAAGIPVIVDATHARRPWRLAITQALALPAPVEWIGWWLYTPMATCLEWNTTRRRRVPEPVIREMAAALADPVFGPSRAEGFAAVVAVVPTHQHALEPLLRDELARLDRRIRSARNRERHLELHGYSRLLDLERLLHLLRLLSTHPGLEAADPASRGALEAIVSPLPEGDLADRAAVFLRRLHGECYGDAAAIRNDLAWLAANGLCDAGPGRSPIRLAPPPDPRHAASGALGGVNGGYPTPGDGPVFQRLFTLLRHLLQQPFDHQAGRPLPEHLIERTGAIPGAYLSGEAATLRKDLEKLLTPYGFRSRNDNVRHGYALGTALLSAHRLREVHAVVSQAAGRLEDPSAQDLLAELEQRLQWGGIGLDRQAPVRAFANRSIVSGALVRPDCLAAERQAERLETAIVERRRVVLERYSAAGTFADSPSGLLLVWPLQILFHNIGWYLVYEDDSVGREEGLIRTERLDRLALRRSEGGNRREDGPHHRALARLAALLHHCGGIYFGDNLEAQLRLCSASASVRARQLTTLRFCCQGWSFAFIREGLQRYPIEHTRFSRPLPGDSWWHHPNAPHRLDPGPATDTHPYPVELDLPSWTVERDIDLRNWLFGFGAGIRIESPAALRQEHITRLREALAVYGEQG
ncbi:AAA family ATPase [Cyanobium sp. NIES-981]|uniref:AAA family ATPase n=1 Tax=Cyanobium sp. NIES-981 TaxID=1851505 RepID=UPI0007DDD3F2|nr:AAA family ATPase [Cyanobium sp. NIES-981]SBO42699.1 putative kinase [Cyanobium sp. NIES-981]